MKIFEKLKPKEETIEELEQELEILKAKRQEQFDKAKLKEEISRLKYPNWYNILDKINNLGSSLGHTKENIKKKMFP